MREFRYRADIDGLRAVAVVLVLLYHAGLGFSGGFIGVDVFFTISGFLITGLVLKRQAAGTFTLRDFWLRRIRRIVPAVSVMVLLTLLAAALVLYPKDYVELAESAVAQQFMAANIYFWQTGGYFNGPAELKPLLHTWSLAVEEQFYLIYPLLLVLAAKRRNRSPWPRFLLLAALFALAHWLTTMHSRAAFFLLPARAWEMLLGGVLWSLPDRFQVSRRQAELVSWCSLLTIIAAAWLFDSTTPFPGMMALVPCGATAALIAANWTHQTSVAHWLSNRWIVFVGLISYSLYLWHWPILVLARHRLGEPSPTVAAILLGLSFVVAYLSWRFVEEPIRRGRFAVDSRRLLGGLTFTVGLLLLATSLVGATGGLPQRYDQATQRLLASINSGHYHRKVSLAELRSGNLPRIGAEDGPVRVLLWGDSHAMTVAPLLDELCRLHGLRAELATFPSTLPVVGYRSGRKWEAPEGYGDAVLRHVRQQQIETIFLVGYWARDADSPGFAEAMRQTVDSLNDAGCHVVLVRDIPEQPNVERRILTRLSAGHRLENLGVSLKQHREKQATADAVCLALHRPGVTVLDPTPFLLGDNDRCEVVSNGVSLYRNADHLSGVGARRLTGMFEAALSDLESRSSTSENTSEGGHVFQTASRKAVTHELRHGSGPRHD